VKLDKREEIQRFLCRKIVSFQGGTLGLSLLCVFTKPNLFERFLSVDSISTLRFSIFLLVCPTSAFYERGLKMVKTE